jgi:hypothetical protein
MANLSLGRLYRLRGEILIGTLKDSTGLDFFVTLLHVKAAAKQAAIAWFVDSLRVRFRIGL